MHCDDPPACTCPSTATRKRPDGIVTIDYDLCIGCYTAPSPALIKRGSRSTASAFAFETAMPNETRDERRLGVATKCTFCVERIDAGVART